ncbi:hypothetical protein EVAR_23224_1 [Eumeta japonica]|uniref:Uncharacterized protein n=1 Tax=Eumeta variegata TaxID=151549 RepID=A0A4C1VF62_EUMVA|nr:hypothetical protein EVAR_23224_1 [Eumeta japonica]
MPGNSASVMKTRRQKTVGLFSSRSLDNSNACKAWGDAGPIQSSGKLVDLEWDPGKPNFEETSKFNGAHEDASLG